jgi:hypothetical protein
MNINIVIDNIIRDYDDFFPINKRLLDKNIYSIFRFLLYSFIIILFISDKYILKLLLFILLILLFICLILVEDKENNYIKNIIYENQIKNFRSEQCRKSTINNPLSNILNTMDERELEMRSCNDKINTNELIENNLTYNLYSDSTDLLDRKTNKNKYIKLNTYYPNDNKSYKDFLYDFNDNNCKVDSMMCRSYDDFRYHK